MCIRATCRSPICRAFETRVTNFRPKDEAELAAIVGEALAREEPLELLAGGSKRGLGRPLQLPHTLDLSEFSGIRLYEPEELVLTAGAATPMAEIEAALADTAPDARLRAGRLAETSRQRRCPPDLGRRDRIQPLGSAPYPPRRRARPFPGLSRRLRTRRAVQGGRPRRQERDGLRSAEAHGGLLRHARGAYRGDAESAAVARSDAHADTSQPQ